MAIWSDRYKDSPQTGIVLHAATLYDFLLWMAFFGREKRFRNRIIDLGRPVPGESILDVGCGTGSLAILAKQRLGPESAIYGIDASPEMIARANKKAKNAHTDITFHEGLVQKLPFPDSSFDVAFTTVMLHHLPQKPRQECLQEIRRVLKTNGRLVIVDFIETERKKKTYIPHLHRHGHIDQNAMIGALNEAHLNITETGELGTFGTRYILATSTDLK